ncbi:hypothetical protein ATEIFO6365_0005033500 [Aspergillus terreus]|uniref:Uncharacterized protein n=1 Tax=Aspergillus terreus TaxID=33178 RepID=A0A5M3Z273_ASPTE|nr:hypothetical protein ATETN484_0007034000 [Aspergillus terreus]GFF16145.1 hypothetical protein ATEIFO6365_0005033500 [Aspergillus terreus]
MKHDNRDQNGQNDQSQDGQVGLTIQEGQDGEDDYYHLPPVTTYVVLYFKGLYKQISADIQSIGDQMRQHIDEAQQKINEGAAQVEPLEVNFTPATFNHWWSQQSAQTRFRLLILVASLPLMVLLHQLLDQADRSSRDIRQHLDNLVAGTELPRAQYFWGRLATWTDTVHEFFDALLDFSGLVIEWFRLALEDLRDAWSGDTDMSSSDSSASSEDGGDPRPAKKRRVDQPPGGGLQAAGA